jgi:ring-1,2-phenylacetyl-CoA epoxidase subunit PaaC
MDDTDASLIREGVAVDSNKIKASWDKIVADVFASSTVEKPADVFMQTGSRKGVHTEHLGYLLAEMQHLHRAFPGAQW